MAVNYQWTQSQACLKLVRANSRSNYNWLFLAGGPGLGSESLNQLVAILDLPGAMWQVDLPGDGSNTINNNTESFSHWQQGLIELVKILPSSILVAHSTGGMFALATSELENNLKGLVLMNSAPNASWQTQFSAYVTEHPLIAAEQFQKNYAEDPSNDNLKKLTIACVDYGATKKSKDKLISLFEILPFNYETHLWSEKNFDPYYEAKWIPKNIPVLIFSGDQDPITPLDLFLKSAEFKRENILLVKIKNASHFSWIDNPEQVKQVFLEYSSFLKSKN